MPGDRPSDADLELVRRLQRAGIKEMSWTRLKRWRRAGLVSDPEQLRIPGRRGSGSAYPPAAFDQALMTARLMRRHRNIDKVAILLFLCGHEVKTEALRLAVAHFLETTDAEFAKLGAGADREQVAERIGRAIVEERPRTHEARNARRKQLGAVGGDADQLANAYSKLARPWIGMALSAGGLLMAFKMLGQDFRQALGTSEAEFSALERRLDASDAELLQEGGLVSLLRTHLPEFELANFAVLRDFCREAFTWVASLGFRLDPTSRFTADLMAALRSGEVTTD